VVEDYCALAEVGHVNRSPRSKSICTLDLRTGLGKTTLHYLAVENYSDAVKLLIDLGASEHITNEFGRTPLDEARMAGEDEAVATLRRAGARAYHSSIGPSC
jgi:ankyrin repeat protein